MTLPSDPLELAVHLAGLMAEVRYNEYGYLEGYVPDDFNFDQIRDALDAASLLAPDDDSSRRYLQILPPTSYFESVDKLLTSASRRSAIPNRFYIHNLHFFYSGAIDESTPPAIVQYSQAVRLFNALKNVADDTRTFGGSESLIFLHHTKLAITNTYNSFDLDEIPGLREFEEEFSRTATHQKQKKTIIKNVLFDVFGDDKEVQLGSVIGRFAQIFEKSEASYQLYVSEFSFEKVKEEVEKEKLEFTAKLNKVFSDIQNQLLAIPAALILIGGQMKPAASWSITNFLIFFGALVFSILMNLLIRNQSHTLEAIKLEIDEQWRLIRGRHSHVAGQFEDSYSQLDTRYEHQRRLLATIDLLVAIALAMALSLLIWNSVPKEIAYCSIGISATLFILIIVFRSLYKACSKCRATRSSGS